MFPSELEAVATRRSVRLAGRVAAVDDRRAVVADATAAVTVELVDGATDPSVGDLVVVRGTAKGGKLTGARLEESFPGRAAPSRSEHQRLAGGVGTALAARANAFGTVREYFAGERFVEVDTPTRVASPGLDAHVHAVRSERKWVITSPEHHMKRLLVGGMPRIFQLAACSRAGEIGPLHEPQFVMLEWYRSFADVDAVIADAENVVERVVHALSKTTRVRGPTGTSVEVVAPFERMTVRAAFRRFAGIADASDLAANDPQRFFQVFVDRVTPRISRKRRPVVLCDYPIAMASYARAHPSKPCVAERFEVFVGGIELCNGFGELTDPREQRARFDAERARRRDARERQHPVDRRFLAALREGLPPSAGAALGMDRLIALALGVERIADVQSFPVETD